LETTSPSLSGSDVDYALNNTAWASLSPDSGETTSGENTTNLSVKGDPTAGDAFAVHANGAGSGDRLEITFFSCPSFRVAIVSTNSPVDLGNTLTVDVEVENTGNEADTQDVDVYLGNDTDEWPLRDDSADGDNVWPNVQVAPGDSPATNTVENDTGWLDGGTYTVTVNTTGTGNGVSQTIDVLGPSPYFQVTNLQAPANAFQGADVTVSADVDNVGEQSDTQTIAFQFDGSQKDTQTLTLAPADGASTVSFTYTVSASLGQHTTSIHSENTSESTTLNVIDPTVERVVFRDSTDGDLKTVDPAGTVTTFGVSQPAALGPGTTDLVGDSAWDVPFVPNGGGSLDVVEDDGSTTTFDANGQDSQPVGVGDWDGDGGDEVVYARGGQLYEVESGTTPDRFLYGCGGRVPNSCSKVSTDGVAGVANVDGDSTTDIVFTDNGDLEYLTGSSTQQNTDPTTTIATGISGSAVSQPADFDDDGTVEIAVEDGGDVTFYNSGGTDDLGTITTSSQVAQAPMAASDWSADEVPDVVYVDSGGDVHYLDATSGTTGLVTKDDGTTVSADSNQGLR
jgi:hypothetical protein